MVDLSKIVVPEELKPTPMVTCVIEGHLEEGDLRELALSAEAPETPPVEDDDPSDLKKVRERHHSVARMIAGGLTQRMVSKLVGYTESYLSVLLNNPAMQELIEFYRIQRGSAAQLITEKLATVGLRALEKLDEKLDKDELTNEQLIQTSKLGLDRGGFGPQSKHLNVNEEHVIDHAELVRLNQEARARSGSYIVPASEVRAALPPPKELDDQNETDGQVASETGLPEDRSDIRSEGEGQ